MARWKGLLILIEVMDPDLRENTVLSLKRPKTYRIHNFVLSTTSDVLALAVHEADVVVWSL